MDYVLVVVIGVFFFWLAGITLFLHKISSHYQRLTAGIDKKSLGEILDKTLAELALGKDKLEKEIQRIDELFEKGTSHIQKIGIVRFNPFSDTGGEQSFILAILDGNDTGFVLTSLHNRGITRWYVKNIKESKGVDYELSEEEKKAIKSATVLKKIEGKREVK